MDIQRSTYAVEAMARAMAGEPVLFGSVDCSLRMYNPHTGECLDLDELAAAIGGVPAAHHLTHEDGGADEIDVTGLSGQLADQQYPVNHDLLDGNYHGDTGAYGAHRGDMIYATNTPFGPRWRDLAVGAAGSFLRVDAGGLPAWTPAADADGFLHSDGAGNLSWQAAGGGGPHLLWDPTMHIDECFGGSPPLYPEDGDIIIYRGVSPGCWTLEKITSYFPGGW